MASVGWMHRIERWLVGVWYGGAQVPKILQWLSGVYRWLLIAKQQRTPKAKARPVRCVIVVGNLVVGGTGKSPVVAALGRLLLAEGHNVAILCRGYQPFLSSLTRRSKKPIKVSAHSAVQDLGDEALMLASQLPCPVWVSKDRCAAYESAIAEGADVVISDDGLQHAKLPRSYEVCVFDGQRLWGNGLLLPAGPLREPMTRLSSVDEVLIKGPVSQCNEAYDFFELVPSALLCPSTGERIEVDALRGHKVSALCAIGHPESFVETLMSLGMVPSPHFYRDHHAYTGQELTGLPEDQPIVITEKDWVKLKALSLPSNVQSRLHVLEVQARLPEGLKHRIVQHVREFKQHD